jgi:HEAT repeat protein
MAAICVISFCVVAGAGAQTTDSARYAEIMELIDDNLHFTAHFRWAVTGETIADLRDEVTPADIPVLIEMLGDEDGKARVAASGLLTTLGDAALPALEAAKESPDYRVSMGANDALIRLGECRSNPAGMNPDACP